MKKLLTVVACVLMCLCLLSGCTDDKDRPEDNSNSPGSVEIDDTDIGIDVEMRPDTEDDSDYVTLPDGVTYTFIDPDNSAGIVVTPKE